MIKHYERSHVTEYKELEEQQSESVRQAKLAKNKSTQQQRTLEVGFESITGYAKDSFRRKEN